MQLIGWRPGVATNRPNDTLLFIALVIPLVACISAGSTVNADEGKTKSNQPASTDSDTDQPSKTSSKSQQKTPHAAAKKTIEVLLITGGCCHNYGYQTNAMQRGMKRVCDQMDIDLRWTIVNKGGKGTHAIIDLYDNPKWADEFDVVIHNECFAKTNDADYIRKITTPHKKGTPAVVIHCAMHTYRDAKIDDWRQFLGVTSRRHDHQSRYPVKTLVSDHVVMKGFPADYVSQKDELYIIEKLWPSATALATSESEKSGKAHPVIWVNQYGKARVFGTTYGHSDETFGDDAFLQLLSRGTLWAAGAL